MVDEIVFIYIFDECMFCGCICWFDFLKVGKFRVKFIIEVVEDLCECLCERGIEFIVRVGKLEEIFFDLVQEVKSSWIFCNCECIVEELVVQNVLEKKLWIIGQEIYYVCGKMLYYIVDLFFFVMYMFDVFI